MVKTSQLGSVVPQHDGRGEASLARLAGHCAPSEIELLRLGLEFIGPIYRDRESASGEPLLQHALGTATILAELKLDCETLAAALLAPCAAISPSTADGATPIDFAYHVHTELGHRCRGAKVDGAIVPLNTGLANGQRIEILAAKQGGPSRDWLNAELGYVRSAAARTKIRQWFNRQNHEAAVAQGRAVVEKELQRQGLARLNLEKLAAQLEFAKLEDFLAEAGRGEIGQRQLQAAVRALDPRVEAAPAAASSDAGSPVLPARKARTATRKSGVLVVGVDRLLTVSAKCCKPAPPDPIIGFVTRRRGVTVHRTGCANVKRLDRSRLAPAEWGESAGATFSADVDIEAARR